MAQVLSSNGKQVATLSMNEGGEILFATKAIELAMHYNKARSLIESNPGGAGTVVIREFQKMGLPLWSKTVTSSGGLSKQPKYWTTSRGSKQEGYAHLRQMVNGDALELKDLSTVQELMHIRESRGRIEGQDGYHDDHSDALMLAEWNRRSLPTADIAPHLRPKRYYARRNPFNTIKRFGES